MPFYTYLVHDDGGVVSPTEPFGLASDHESMMLAFFVIRDHPECRDIEVWCGERRVLAQDYAERRLLRVPQHGHPA